MMNIFIVSFIQSPKACGEDGFSINCVKFVKAVLYNGSTQRQNIFVFVTIIHFTFHSTVLKYLFAPNKEH